MSRFDFESPGAAFTDSMAQVLAERKAEERQKMLDSLTMAADQRAQQQMQQDQAWREKQHALQLSADERAKVEFLGGGLDPSDMDVSDNLSPQDLELMRRYGRVSEVPGAGVSTDASVTNPEDGWQQHPIDTVEAAPPTPPTYRYTGDKAYQEKQRIVKQQTEAIAAKLNSSDPNEQQKGRMLSDFAKMNDGVIPPQAWEMLMPDQPLYIFDEASGNVKDSGKRVPRGTQVIQRGHPPNYGGNRRAKVKVGQTRDGRIIYADEDGNESIGTNSVGPDAGQEAFGIPVGLLEQHAAAVGAYADDPEDQVALNAFRTSATYIIGNAKSVSPRVREILMRYADNPANGAQYQANIMMSDKPLNENEQFELNQLMYMTQLNRFKKELQASAPKPSASGAPVGAGDTAHASRMEDLLAKRTR